MSLVSEEQPGVTKNPSPVSIAILHYDGAQDAAVLGLRDVLETAAHLHQERTGAVHLEVRVVPEALLSNAPARPFSALVVPPALGAAPPADVSPAVASWIRDRHAEGTVLCSVCVGAYLLAHLSLLDGRKATTHWAIREDFAKRFPKVHVNTDSLVIDDGDLITAGGLMAWTGLALRLIGRFLGPATTLEVSRYFLVDPGGREQRFYQSFSPVLTHGDEAILRAQRWLQNVAHRSVSVDEMAKEAGLGRRTFLRRFLSATGMHTTPYLQQVRVALARELLEQTSKSQQEVAWAVGYEDATAFRRVFLKHMGLSPGEYRRRFRA